MSGWGVPSDEPVGPEFANEEAKVEFLLNKVKKMETALYHLNSKVWDIDWRVPKEGPLLMEVDAIADAVPETEDKKKTKKKPIPPALLSQKLRRM